MSTDVYRVAIPDFGILVQLTSDLETKAVEIAQLIRREVLGRALKDRSIVLADSQDFEPSNYWLQECSAEIQRVGSRFRKRITCALIDKPSDACLDALANDPDFFVVGLLTPYVLTREQLSKRSTQKLLLRGDLTYDENKVECVQSNADGSWILWAYPTRIDGFDDWLRRQAAAAGATAHFREAALSRAWEISSQ